MWPNGVIEMTNLIEANDLCNFADEVSDLCCHEAPTALMEFIEGNATATEFTANKTERGWEISFNRTIITDDISAFAQLVNSVAGVNWK